MLLVKYIMQLTVSTMPAGIETEMRRKKYDQERKRYMTLRAKKERRSGSVGIAGGNQIRRNDSVDKGGEVENISPLLTSPCPPIRESSAECYSEYTGENKNDETFVEKPKGGIVNVRATKIHSPFQEKNGVGSHRRGSRQKHPSRNHSGHSIGKGFVGPSSSTTKYEENHHPNFEEAISKFPRRSPTTNRSPMQTQGYAKNMSSAKNTRRSGAPSSDAHQGYGSKYWEVARSHHQQQHHEEEVLSPSSTLSTTKPGMPTPCQLNLDSDDDTLYTVEDGFATTTPAGFTRVPPRRQCHHRPVSRVTLHERQCHLGRRITMAGSRRIP